MRSLAEIDAEIDAVKARMARRAEGLPTRESPEYRASRFDYVVEGNRQGLDQFQSALQTAMQNKLQRELTEREGEKNRQNAREIAMMSKAEAAAERRQKAEELAALKLAQARPEYMTLQKQMLDAADSGNLEEAAIIKSQMEALEAEHGVQFGSNAQGLIDARDKARIERQNREAAEGQRRLKVASFTSTIPTTFKNETDKTDWYAAIQNNPDMTPDEKATEIERIRNTESGNTKVKKAVQGAVASGAGDDVKKAKELKDKTIKDAKAAYEFQKKYPNRPLTASQKAAMATADANGWNYKD